MNTEIVLVFFLSSRCNLECSYCNVDAGPIGYRPQLDIVKYEQWLKSFYRLDPGPFIIQLHGGEPLLMKPTIEEYSLVARNVAEEFETISATGFTIVTNGHYYTPERASLLATMKIGVTLSLDGPAHIHDRNRFSARGGSHADAERALSILRQTYQQPRVIGVVSEPAELQEVVDYFQALGLTKVRLNPMRPVRRGLSLVRSKGRIDDEPFMRDLADAYVEMALRAAKANRSGTKPAFVEVNMGILMQLVLRRKGLIEPQANLNLLPFFFTEDAALWHHFNMIGDPRALVARGDRIPDTEELADLLACRGADGTITRETVSAAMNARPSRFLKPCEGCTHIDVCSTFSSPTEAKRDPMCAWISRVLSRFEAWVESSPEEAAFAAWPEGLEGRAIPREESGGASA